MKSALIALLIGGVSGMAMAQQPANPVQPKKATTTAAPAVKPKAKVEAKAVAARIELAETVLSRAELDIAERVYVGLMPCELGNAVTLTPDSKAPGYFDLHLNKSKFRLIPVLTTTGAIRLEDGRNGAVWLQLANKSMLMNHKLGQRMADECMSAQQIVVAEQLKINPPRSLLEGPIPGAAAGLGAAPVTSPVIVPVPASSAPATDLPK